MSQQSKVLREFTSHPGEILYKEDIAATTGLTEKQVVQTIWNLQQKSQPIIKVAEGSWKYDPKDPSGSGRELFEKLAESKDGEAILQDESGSFWVARRMKF